MPPLADQAPKQPDPKEGVAAQPRKPPPRFTYPNTPTGFLYALICLYFLALFYLILEFVARLGRTLTALQISADTVSVVLNGALSLLLAYLLVSALLRVFIHVKGLLTQHVDDAREASAGIQVTVDDAKPLFDVIDDVRQTTGSPMPHEVRIGPLPDCYAVEVRWFSMSTRRRLVLVLGLPLFVALTVDEIKVLLAHELAHFSGGHTRMTVFVFRFLATLKLSLKRCQNTSWRKWVDPFCWFDRAYFLLMAAVSGSVVRNLEFGADRISAANYGASLARETLLKNWLISQQFNMAIATYPHDTEKPRRSANYYSYFGEIIREFSADGLQYLENRLEETEPDSLWDSHPPIPQRLAAMRDLDDKPRSNHHPARFLLPEYESLCVRLHKHCFVEEEPEPLVPFNNEDEGEAEAEDVEAADEDAKIDEAAEDDENPPG